MKSRAVTGGLVLLVGVAHAIGACSREERAALIQARVKETEQLRTRTRDVLAKLGADNHLQIKNDELVVQLTSPAPRSLARLLKPTLVGARSAAISTTEPQVVRPGLVEIERGWATEHIEETGRGIEQSWLFETKPEMPTVQIRIPVSDATVLGSGNGGLVFRTADQRYLTYSDATWVDARGERSRVPARFVDGAIELVVPQAVLERSEYPAVLDPIIGVENVLTPDKLVAAENVQGYAGRIAIGVSSRLMAWSDGREGTVDGVYFTFVDESNSGVPFALAAGRRLGYASLTGQSVIPSVAYANGQYIVAWASYHTVSWARINENGTVLDVTPKTLTVDAGNLTSASVAAFGSDFMIAWIDRASGNGDVSAVRVGSNGVAVESQPIPVVADSAAQAAPSIRSSADGYWVVFQDNTNGNDDVRLVRLLANGTVVDKVPVPIVETYAEQRDPDIALDSAGQAGIVVWDDSATLAIHGASVSPSAAGTVSVGTAARISTGSGERAPRVAYNGAGYQIAWISSQNGSPAPQVALLPSGNPERATGAALGVGWSNFVDLASHGSQIEAMWDSQNTQTRSYDIFHQTGTASNAWSGASYLVSRAATTQVAPRIANNSSRFIVAWETPRVGGKAIEVARVNPLGEFEDPKPIQISNITDDQRLAGVYSNDTDFLVVWHQYEMEAKTQRLSWRVLGKFVSDAGVPASTSYEFRNYSGIYADPVDVWIDYDVFPWAYMFTFIDGDVIYNAQVLASGVRGNSKFLYEADSVINALSLRSTSKYVYYLSTTGYIHRVTQTKDMRGGTGGQYLALPGSASTFDVTPDDVLALYNSQGGTVSIVATGWTRTLATGLTSAANPKITHMPTGYLVAWNEGDGIVGARVTSDGQVMDAQPVTLSQEPSLEQLGDMYTDFLDRCIMTYSRPMWVPGVGSKRVATRLIDFRYNEGKDVGQTCSTGFACKTGFCADGVCCDTGCGFSIADCQVCSKALGASADGVCSTLSAGTACRAATGVCDIAEICNGTSVNCPVDSFSSNATACGNAAVGLCDKADHCSGTSGECLAEGLLPAGTICRVSRGLCDAADTCDGVSVDCADQLYGTDHVCRPASTTCDVADYCDGAGDECGIDLVKQAGAECRGVGGDCDLVEVCDGSTKSCPVDAFQSVGKICRVGSNPCDVAEACTGTSAKCPADVAVAGCGVAGSSSGGFSGSDVGNAGSRSDGVSGGAAASETGGSSALPGTSAVGVGGSRSGDNASGNTDADSDSGCGCRTAGAASRRNGLASALVLLIAISRRRRMQRRRP